MSHDYLYVSKPKAFASSLFLVPDSAGGRGVASLWDISKASKLCDKYCATMQ